MGQRNLCGRWTVESATSSVRSFMNYIKGITTRRTRLGVEIVRVHYTADPERNSEWAIRERQKYSSQAAWDREQEIVHDAGGGELLFAEILNRHADKIIIRDPDFEIPPTWKRIAGFDHGKTNPTAALVVAIDYDGRVYCLCEYYQPGLTPSQLKEGFESEQRWNLKVFKGHGWHR